MTGEPLGMESTDVRLARIEEKLATMAEKIDGITTSLGEHSPYVTKDAFAPVQRVVYGLVATALASFLAAIAALIWKP